MRPAFLGEVVVGDTIQFKFDRLGGFTDDNKPIIITDEYVGVVVARANVNHSNSDAVRFSFVDLKTRETHEFTFSCNYHVWID